MGSCSGWNKSARWRRRKTARTANTVGSQPCWAIRGDEAHNWSAGRLLARLRTGGWDRPISFTHRLYLGPSGASGTRRRYDTRANRFGRCRRTRAATSGTPHSVRFQRWPPVRRSGRSLGICGVLPFPSAEPAVERRRRSGPSPHTVDHVRKAIAKLRPEVLVPPPDPHSLCRGVVAKGHQMGVHFTNHSPQLGVLVVVGFIVNADQDVFDGLCHDGALPQGTKLAPANNGRVWAKYGAG